MIRLIVFGFVLANFCSANAWAQKQDGATSAFSKPDNLMSRIRKSQHMGLRTDERLGGVTLYLYTPEQHAQNRASIAAYRKELEVYNAEIEMLDQKRRDAQQRRAPIDELNAITHEKNRTRRPDSQFVRSVILYNVVHFGDDYIELTRAENPKGSTLIPLSRICKVIVTPSDDPEKDEQ